MTLIQMTQNNSQPRAKKTSTASKTTKKKAPTSNKKSAKQQKKMGWLRRILMVLLKLLLAILAVFFFSGLYLNSLVSSRFDHQLFELPNLVYGRSFQLTPNMPLSLAELKTELNALHYRQVTQPTRAGEYSVSATKMELIRRSFDFIDGSEPDRHVMLHFSEQNLVRIQSLEQAGDFSQLRLEPKLLGSLEQGEIEQRLFLRREQFPELLIDALLLTEDRQFYQHDGIAPLAILRALWVNVNAGRTVQGASTLTQQLAKNMFLSSDKSLWRKLREAYLAVIIDYKYSKDRILEAYLNEVYLGQNGQQAIHGFGLAAQWYFGQPINELRADQLALLVAMVKGASYYHPVRYPERTKQRRDLVLKLMVEQSLLTPQQYELALSFGLGIQKKPDLLRRQPAYFQQVKRELTHQLSGRMLTQSGLRIFTSLDPLAQQKLETAVIEQLASFNKEEAKVLEAAAVVVDRQTGEVRAMLGGKQQGYDGFNRALNARRPIGSLVKPAVYLTALAQPDRYHLATTLFDQPLTLKSSQGQVWEPRNVDRRFRGLVPLYQALAQSLNVPTVRLGMQLGLENVVATLQQLGVDKERIQPVPALLLGALSLSPYEVAQMYQSLANSGKRVRLSSVQAVINQQGQRLYQALEPKAVQVVAQQAAWLTVYAMKLGVSQGTGRFLHNDFAWASLAGKTGTTNDSKDSWFVGVDGREVAVIWLGRDDNKPTKLSGSSGALRVYARFLAQRAPQVLRLPWPQEITSIGFATQSDGTRRLDCLARNQLPVWDKAGQWKTQCEQASKSWFERILAQ